MRIRRCASLVATSTFALVFRAVMAQPDALQPVEFRHGELDGPIDAKVMNLVSNHYLKIDVDRRWVSRFRDRTERGSGDKGWRGWRYEGVGKLLDAGSLLTAYTEDPAVAAQTRKLLEGLRATRDQDGYVGFWKTEPGHAEEYVNWTLHEQEYLLLGQVRYHLCTGDKAALDDARKTADFIMATFPTEENGIDAKRPAHLICTAGLPEAFLALYRATGDRKYLDFAANTKHGYDQSEVKCMSLRDWEQGIGEFPNHVYVMTARCNAQTELYRIDGSEKLLTMSRRMLDALFAPGRGGMLVTGSCSQNEHFTYNHDGAGAVGESCVTAYMLRWLDSLMRLDGDFTAGDVVERTAYNAFFAATSPDGSRIRYFTPLTGERAYDGHDGGFCCCGNFRRALAELPRKVCYVTKDGALAMNLYAPFRKTFAVKGKPFTLRCETAYPSEGTVRYTFETASDAPLAFRVPHWATDMTIAVNNEPPQAATPNGKRLAVVARRWQAGDVVTLKMPMRVRTVRGREMQKGRFSLLRGPQVFCLGTNANARLFARHPDFRSLRIDPKGFGEPVRDDSIRPNGRKITGRAWTDPSCKGEPVPVVFTEYPDPSGIETFFLGDGGEEDDLGRGMAPVRERVLFLSAHPDDIISSLGTCLLMRDKFEIHVVDFTHGERGLGEKGFLNGSTKARRIKEEESVMAAIGAQLHWLDQIDGDSWVTKETCTKLAKLIEDLKPRAIFGHWPIDLHMDHMMSAATLQKAVRMTGYNGEFYFFEESFDSKGFPDVFYVDVTSVAKEKERLIRLYVCQNEEDAMCREEMRNSANRATRLWPFRENGCAEAFAPYVGRPQGPCIFAELPRDPDGAKMPEWGR